MPHKRLNADVTTNPHHRVETLTASQFDPAKNSWSCCLATSWRNIRIPKCMFYISNFRQTASSQTDTPLREVFRHNAKTQKTQAKTNISRPLPKSDKRDRLDPHNIEALPAPNILAAHRVVAAHHIALRLGKTSPVAVIGPSRQLRLLPPHHPVNLILALLPAVWTRHHMRPLLRLLIKKVPLFHRHLAGRRPARQPSPICNPA
jgi:hypothetical protein